MTKGGWLVAIVAALVIGKLWLSGHDADLRATQALRAKDAANAALVDTVQTLTHQVMAAEDRADSIGLANTAQIQQASVRADSLQRVEVVRYVELRGAVPVNLRPMVDSLQSAHAQELAAKDSIIGSYRDENAALRALRPFTDSLMAKQGRALAEALRQRDAWKGRASPGLMEKVRRGLPWVAAGALAVLVLRH